MAKSQSSADSAHSLKRVLTLFRCPAIDPARLLDPVGSRHTAGGAEVRRHHSVATAPRVSADS
jgi:hypothetical protein